MDFSAAYSMNTSENAFGDGDGYAGALTQSAPATPAVASTARKSRGNMNVNHHLALIVVVGAVILYFSHHVGFRGVVAR